MRILCNWLKCSIHFCLFSAIEHLTSCITSKRWLCEFCIFKVQFTVDQRVLIRWGRTTPWPGLEVCCSFCHKAGFSHLAPVLVQFAVAPLRKALAVWPFLLASSFARCLPLLSPIPNCLNRSVSLTFLLFRYLYNTVQKWESQFQVLLWIFKKGFCRPQHWWEVAKIKHWFFLLPITQYRNGLTKCPEMNKKQEVSPTRSRFLRETACDGG